MNFTAVRGYNAYAQFSIKIREAVANRIETSETPKVPDKIESSSDVSRRIYSEPVDIISISQFAKNASAALEKPIRETTALTEFKEWSKRTIAINSGFSQTVSGITMNEMLGSTGIKVDENEEYDINMDVWCAVTVSGRNTEKARAIQDLLNSTPGGINWGFLLQKLPIR